MPDPASSDRTSGNWTDRVTQSVNSVLGTCRKPRRFLRSPRTVVTARVNHVDERTRRISLVRWLDRGPHVNERRPVPVARPCHAAPGDRMAKLTIPLSFPPPLTSATAKFIGVSNVLGGIRTYDHGGLANSSVHIDAACHLAAAGATRSSLKPLDRESGRHLRIGWQTELAARVSDQIDDDVLRRVAAQTLPVQVYYAIFNMARAATTVRGTPCHTHNAVHRDYQSQRSRYGYRSWGVVLSGDPDDLAGCAILPPVTVPNGFNPMELSHQPEEYLFAGLRMTRRWKMEQARATWLKTAKTATGQPRKSLPAVQRALLASGLRPTTVLDFVYELRVRTNYEGVEEYGSDADNATVSQFHNGLLHLADTGLLHYEMDIARTIGIVAYEVEVDNWIGTTAKVGTWARDAVDRRRLSIRQVLTT
jgi:hypothetical protein